MAITYPRTLPDVAKFTKAAFNIERIVERTSFRDGSQQRVEIGMPMWKVQYTTRPLDRDEVDELKAWWDSLRGGLKTFYAYPAERPYPVNYPNGFTDLEATATALAFAPFPDSAVLTIVDVSDTDNPVELSSYGGTTAGTSLAGIRDVAVSGNYAYCACATRASLAVIDISDLNNPSMVAEVRGTVAGTTLAGASAVVIDGDYALVACTTRGSVAVIDISDPENPSFVKEVRGDTPGTTLAGARAMAISNGYLFVACSDRASMAVISLLSSPAYEYVTEIRGTVAGTTLDGAADVVIKDGTAFLACFDRGSLAAIDITDPTAPVFLSEVRGSTPGTTMAGAHSVHINSDYASVACATLDIVVVYDVTNPSNMLLVDESASGVNTGLGIDDVQTVTMVGIGVDQDFEGEAEIYDFPDANSIGVYGLPPGFKLKTGDYVEINETNKTPALHRIVEDVTANSFGRAVLLVEPFVLTNVFTTDAKVNFDHPKCEIVPDPDSWAGDPTIDFTECEFGGMQKVV